jgi:hypothetical protein
MGELFMKSLSFVCLLLSFSAWSMPWPKYELRPDGTPKGGNYTWATDNLGDIVIDVSTFKKNRSTKKYMWSAELKTKQDVWTGWWFPIFEDLMFAKKDGVLSPLQKYDWYVWTRTGKQVNPRTAKIEQNHPLLYDPKAFKDSGRCDSWAKASSYTKEPRQPVTRNGVTFSVFDLKALLTSSYDVVEGIQGVGQEFEKLRKSSRKQDYPEYGDLYPDQLHRLIEVYLKDKRKPFLIDYDPYTEKWNVPVYMADMYIYAYEGDNTEIFEVAGSPDEVIFKVNVDIYYADNHIKDRKNFVGIEHKVIELEYELYARKVEGTKYKVVYGEWMGASRRKHPDYAIVLPEGTIKRSSYNKGIDPAIVDEIVYGIPANWSRINSKGRIQ